MSTSTICLIEKELINHLHFPTDDVLPSKTEQVNRDLNLKRALSLGNLDHSKVKITFQDIEGTKQVETTVWGVTDKEIILKQGRTIPIRRVIDVQVI